MPSRDKRGNYVNDKGVVIKVSEYKDGSGMKVDFYDNVVDYCVEQIEQGNYDKAYNRYKNSVLILEEQFAKPEITNRFVKNLKLKNNN